MHVWKINTERPLYISWFLFLIYMRGYHAQPQSQVETDLLSTEAEETKSPLIGAWELIYAIYGLPDAPVKIESPDAPIQLKLFTDKHYAHVMHDTEEAFLGASAGTYKIQGDHYIEMTG